MKFKSRLLIGILAMGMVAGCSSDEIMTADDVTSVSVNDGEKVFMSVNVKLPTAGGGTRSNTTNNGQSNSGVEIGKDYENNVSTMLIVLTDVDNKIITHATVANLNTSGAEVVEGSDGTLTIKNANVTATASFKKTAIANYYSGDNVDGDGALKNNSVRVYTFCNYTADLLNAVSEGAADWYDKTCTVSENADGGFAAGSANPWGKNSFLMSNTIIATRKIPAKLNDWNAYAYATSPFNLSGSNGGDDVNNGGATGGDIRVMRSVARFDYKDGSDSKDNTYWVGDESTATLKMKLTKMALVNMSKNFYYLPRVSDDGLPEDAVICGSETSTNYVVSPWNTEKQNGTVANDYSQYYNFRLGYGNGDAWTIDETARGQWYTTLMTDVTGGEQDEDETWGGSTKGDYRIWRYVTENTIPRPKAGDVLQANGISTGVVFKGQFQAVEGKTKQQLADAINLAGSATSEADLKSKNCPVLYVFDKIIYVDWTAGDSDDPQDVIACATAANEGTAFFRAVFGKNAYKEEIVTEVDGQRITTYEVKNIAEDSPAAIYKRDGKFTDDFRTAAVNAGFTLYEASYDVNTKGGYYCYYFYWNRHNDNGDPAAMGPMEFAVVRNNVYKLSVTKIGKLGHPRVSKNDPEPIEPDTPDENGDLYIMLSVEIDPWIVRENNIEFN